MIVRGNAARVLGTIGPDAKAAVPALQKLLSAKPWISEPKTVEMARLQAAIAIGKITLDWDPVLPVLIDYLETNQDESIRSKALDCLAEIGASARVAIPAIRKVLQNSDTKNTYRPSQFHERARQALEKIDPQTVTESPTD